MFVEGQITYNSDEQTGIDNVCTGTQMQRAMPCIFFSSCRVFLYK
jgi:hypothetical protein